MIAWRVCIINIYKFVCVFALKLHIPWTENNKHVHANIIVPKYWFDAKYGIVKMIERFALNVYMSVKWTNMLKSKLSQSSLVSMPLFLCDFELSNASSSNI